MNEIPRQAGFIQNIMVRRKTTLLEIVLKNDERLVVENFKEVFIPSENVSTQKPDHIILRDKLTYAFKGDNILTINGSEILYLEFTESN